MSTKFFTLIFGDQVHLARGRKIIPEDTISKLLDADEVMNGIKKDAEKYRLQIAQESEEIKEVAFKQGYAEGFEKWAERLAEFEQEVEKLQQELQKIVVPIALTAAKKIVGREIELSEETIVDIVATNIKSVSQHKKIVIYVNKKDLATLEKNKPRLRDLFEHLESLSIRSRDDIAPGGCVIETEVGIINAQMDHRWKVLEKAFENLIKTNPEKLKGS